MAYSRECVARSRVGVFQVFSNVVLLLFLLAALSAPPAFAASSTAERVVEPVSVQQVSATAFGIEMIDVAADGSMMLSMPRLCPVMLSSVSDPALISVGVDCGMDWMCGIEPCLCGSADAWGGCSCNGLDEIEPTVVYTSSDDGVVRVVEVANRSWLVAVAPGTATVTTTASLRYFSTATANVTVTVEGPALVDVVFVGCGVLAVALVMTGVMVLGALVRKWKRVQSEAKGKW